MDRSKLLDRKKNPEDCVPQFREPQVKVEKKKIPVKKGKDDTVEERKSVPFPFRISITMKKRLLIYSANRDLRLSQAVRRFIKRGLADEGF